MKILPDSPPPPHAFRSSLRTRNRTSSEIDICAESFRTVNLSRAGDTEDDDLPPRRASLRSSSHGDHGSSFSRYGDGFYSENLEFCSSHRFKGNTAKDVDDDDGMQWANAMGPLQMALRSFGYGDNKASGKENKVKVPCKLASFPSSIAQQQHTGLIKPNSGPFSGPLRVTAKPNSVVKANMPVNLFCKMMLGFDVSEPMSPKVTCLGRVIIKENCTHNKVATTTDVKPAALAQKVEKGRCFDTKNQLCGKKAKGRKKKTIAEKSRCLSRRRKFMSKEAADSKSFSSFASSELGETRREKAASLARSLTVLLEDVRRLEKDNSHYVPSVPPQNSLLLMRGSRMRDGICSPIRHSEDEATVDDRSVGDSPRVEALDEDGPCEANVKNLRNSAPLHISLLDLIDMEYEDFYPSEVEDSMTTRRNDAIAQGTSLPEREASENDNDKKNESKDKGSTLMPVPRASLWQRRAVAELTSIEVKQRTKQEIKRLMIR